MHDVSVYLLALKYKNTSSVFAPLSSAHYSVIKGEALSMLAYGEAGMRHTGDIDLLISRANLSLFEKILKQNGFTTREQPRSDRVMMMAYSHQVFPWFKNISPWGNVTIDLNFDIFWGEYTGKRVDIDEFLSDTAEIEIYGVKVKTLLPLKAMVQLILHHYKDMNSIFLLATRKSIKYEMFKDLYYLLKNNIEAIPLDRLYTMSKEYEIIPYVYHVLYHTGLLFDDVILKEYIAAFKTLEGESLINSYGLNDSERREWRYDFNARLETDSIYELIKDDLTDNDVEKIRINRKVF